MSFIRDPLYIIESSNGYLTCFTDHEGAWNLRIPSRYRCGTKAADAWLHKRVLDHMFDHAEAEKEVARKASNEYLGETWKPWPRWARWFIPIWHSRWWPHPLDERERQKWIVVHDHATLMRMTAMCHFYKYQVAGHLNKKDVETFQKRLLALSAS